MGNVRLWLAVLLTACHHAPSATLPVVVVPPASAPAPPPRELPSLLHGSTVALTLQNRAFPSEGDRPDAAVYIPDGFDRSRPFGVVVYLHGWKNCAVNVLRAKDYPCSPGGPSRSSHDLAAQLQASGKNAILVVPQLSFDQEDSAAGHLGDDKAFLAMMTEVLEQLAPRLGRHKPKDIAHLVVVSYSGGYRAAASILARGGLRVDEVLLLDSLNGGYLEIDAWVNQANREAAFAGDAPRRRFASIYSADGGTAVASRQMVARANVWFTTRASIVDDRTPRTPPAAALRHGLIFKLTSLDHDEIPRVYFRLLLDSSGLPDRASSS